MAGRNLDASVLPAFPLLLLLLALSTVFLFGNDRDHFYRYGRHNNITGNHLAVAANLSPAHNFLMFYRQTLDADGVPTYEPYNRFPIGGFLLIRMAILPFNDDLTTQLYAARLLMLLFFTATAGLAWLSLSRLTSHRWSALTATLLAFSSSHCLYYNDMVATEAWPDLFGVWLVFHGMVIFVQEGCFRQLLVKTCLVLLLGWHVYALLLPFVVLGLAGDLAKARSVVGQRRGNGYLGYLYRLKGLTASVLGSRYLVLGVAALLFGTAVLSFNLAHEYFALNGEQGLTDLPSFQSMLKRTGQDEGYSAEHGPAWLTFLKLEFYRIGGMFLPYTLMGHDGVLDRYYLYPGPPFGLQHIIGIAVSCACLIGLAVVRPTILWAPMVLSGFCWSLPMRHNTAFHNFETIFHIGLPLLLFSLVLWSIQNLSGHRLSVAVGLSVAASLVFVLSSFQMSHLGYTAEAAEFEKNRMADYEMIRKMTAGKVAAVPESMIYNMRYALTGTILLFSDQKTKFADFVINHRRYHDAAVLTPENRRVFLYRRSSYEGAIDTIIKEAGEPLIHAESRKHVFDVYRSDNDLYYVRNPTRDTQPTAGSSDARFFLHVIPVNLSDLSEHRKQWKFDNLDFSFSDRRIPHSTRAIAVRTLPSYDIARIRTGQFTKEVSLWKKLIARIISDQVAKKFSLHKNLWEAEVGFDEEPDDD